MGLCFNIFGLGMWLIVVFFCCCEYVAVLIGACCVSDQ